MKKYDIILYFVQLTEQNKTSFPKTLEKQCSSTIAFTVVLILEKNV